MIPPPDSNQTTSELLQTALISGCFAAIVAIAATRAIEVLGPRFGSIVSTLPTTIIPASLGLCVAVSYCKNPQSSPKNPSVENNNYSKLVSAMFMVSGGMLVNAVYLSQWKYWPEKISLFLDGDDDQTAPVKNDSTLNCIKNKARSVWLAAFRCFGVTNKNIQILIMTLWIAFGIWLKCSLIMILFVEQLLGDVQSRTMIFGLICVCVQVIVGVRSVMNDYEEKKREERELADQQQRQRQQKEKDVELENREEITRKEDDDQKVFADSEADTKSIVVETAATTNTGETTTTSTSVVPSTPASPTTIPSSSAGGVSWKTLLLRGSAAGVANFVCILLSSVSGVVSGLAATFPAIFTTIMVSLWFSHSAEDNNADASASKTKKKNLSSQSIGPIILGSVAVPVYAISFSLLVTVTDASSSSTGGLLAVVGAWLIAVCFASYPASRVLEAYKK